MEATEGGAEGIVGKILPPRLEDAGLEECALPPEAIKEAFAKAATAVRSIISASSGDDEAEGHCVNDPSIEAGGSSDALVGITDGVDYVPGSCANEKGGGVPEVASDEVAVRDEDEKVDQVVIGGPSVRGSGEDACVDGLQGLDIGEKSKSKSKVGKKPSDDDDDADGDGEEKGVEIPTLTEAYA